MRKPYNGINDQFDVKDLISKEPFRNFQHWLEQACNCSSVYEPNAMAIATATALVLLLLTVVFCLLWPPCGLGQAIVFSSGGFFFFSSPDVSGRRLEPRFFPP